MTVEKNRISPSQHPTPSQPPKSKKAPSKQIKPYSEETPSTVSNPTSEKNVGIRKSRKPLLAQYFPETKRRTPHSPLFPPWCKKNIS